MSVTMEEIRAKWPNAIPSVIAQENLLDPYCVGGAVCRFTDGLMDFRFPTDGSLAERLRVLNRSLSLQDALCGAINITSLNDAGNMDEAWAEVDRLLKLHG